MSFFFNDTATTEIYTLSLHDALPISKPVLIAGHIRPTQAELGGVGSQGRAHDGDKESEDQGSSKTGTSGHGCLPCGRPPCRPGALGRPSFGSPAIRSFA